MSSTGSPVSRSGRSRSGRCRKATRRARSIRRRSRSRPSRAAYNRQGLAVDDLIDFTPELRAEAVKAIAQYKIGPVFTPPVVSKAEGPIATLQMASQGAATNWPGGSYDPETHILYVYSQSAVATLGLVPPPPGSAPDVRYHQGTVLAGARRSGGSGSASWRGGWRSHGADDPGPASRSSRPTVSINAISLDTGDILWQVPHGETPDAIKNHPALKGLNIPRTGRAGQCRHARHEDAPHLRRARFRHDDDGTARIDAARVRQEERNGSGGGLHACAANRIADDLHAQREAVPRRRHQWRQLLRGAAGAATASMKALLIR